MATGESDEIDAGGFGGLFLNRHSANIQQLGYLSAVSLAGDTAGKENEKRPRLYEHRLRTLDY